MRQGLRGQQCYSTLARKATNGSPPPGHRRASTRSSLGGADSPCSWVDEGFKDHLSLIEHFCGQVTVLSAFMCLGPLLQIKILQGRIFLSHLGPRSHSCTSNRPWLLAPASLASLAILPSPLLAFGRML